MLIDVNVDSLELDLCSDCTNHETSYTKPSRKYPILATTGLCSATGRSQELP